MEVVVFLSMMIVPFISIASLVVSVLAKKRSDALKDIVLNSMQAREKREAEQFIKIQEL